MAIRSDPECCPSELLEEKSSAELELKAASLPLLESIESDVLKVFAVSNMIVCR